MRISPTACSNSVCVTPRNLSMRGPRLPSQVLRRRRGRPRPRRRDDERPGVAGGSRHLRVDEHVLDLLACDRPGGRRGGACGRSAPVERSRSATARSGHSPRAGPRRTRVRRGHRRRDRRASCRGSKRAARPARLRASRGRRGRSPASASRLRSAPGWRRRRSGRISSRISPRFVSTFAESTRYARPCSSQ